MNDKSVTEEIRKHIEERISEGVIVRPDWLALGILEAKNDISGGDVEFYRVCAYHEILRVAKRTIGKFEVTDSTPEQLVLPGFKHLCKAYTMERDGVVMLVPVDACTDSELMSRATQLEEMAKGCRAHARELLDYVQARASAVAA